MCNLYTQSKSPDEIARLFATMQMPLGFPEGIPNLQQRDIAITDNAPVVRAVQSEPGAYELLIRRWSWPGAHGKPLYNLRCDGREFRSGRALVIADGFYEFTTPANPTAKRKDRWLFSDPERPLIAIAGLIRAMPGSSGEAFSLLTTSPGPDVIPYHSRQVAILPPDKWRLWLNHAAPATELLGPSPVGALTVRAAPRED